MTASEAVIAVALTAVYIVAFNFASARDWLPSWILTLISLPLLALIWTRHISARMRRGRRSGARKD